MAITREELKVGEVYITASKDALTVTAIGDDFLLAKTKMGHEYCYKISSLLDSWSLKPKQKKTIELIGFLSDTGYFREVLNKSEEYNWFNSREWKKISTRTIEIDE